MANFADLAASRRTWINDVLIPWCRQAARTQLRLAELEWHDIAGRVDPEKTLWAWAWSRLPGLVHEELGGIDESGMVSVLLSEGRTFVGYPDARQSKQGELVLLCRSDESGRFLEAGPFSIDDIQSVRRIGPTSP